MLATGFILFTLAMAILLLAGLAQVAKTAIHDPKRRNAFLLKATLTLTAWLTYLTVMSLKGVFTSLSLPPRVPLLLVLPPFAFISFFFLGGKFKNIIASTPAHWPVYFQGFRIVVELFLLNLFLNGLVPKEATFEGYNYDLLIGLTAPVMGWLVFGKQILGRTALIIWNVCGFITLATVVFVFMTHAYLPQIWHKQADIAHMGFGQFPYTYLAGFLMPCAIFMHIFSLVKLKR